MAAFIERDERCIFIGNLDGRVTEEILWELFLQAGPLDAVHIPKDKETGKIKTFGFVSFSHEVSVRYAIDLMNGINLYGRALTVKLAQQNTNSPGNQSPSISGLTPLRMPLFDNRNGQSSPHSSPLPLMTTPSPARSENVNPFQARYSMGAQWDRQPLFDNRSGQTSPHSSPLPFMTTPSPSRNEIDTNFQGRHPMGRNQWDMMSPYQQNGLRDIQGRLIPQSGHSPSPQFLPPQSNRRHFRPSFL